jgi:hypothetical protein
VSLVKTLNNGGEDQQGQKYIRPIAFTKTRINMKNIIAYLILIIVIFSCKTPENQLVAPSNISIKDKEIKFTDKVIAEYGINLMRVDSSFNYEWDWTQQIWDVNIVNYLGQTVSMPYVTSPFWDASQKYSHVDITKVDMYPKDGWTLFKRDLGNKTSSPNYPYVILYNSNRGLLRVCIMRTRPYLQSFEETTLSFENSYVSKDTTATPLFSWIITQHDVSKLDKSKMKASTINLTVKEVARYYSNGKL